MLTFDGERYDFQNAGDYLLSASEDESFVIQTQLFRRNTSSSWSLNGGVVVNVNGDIVEFRGTEMPIDGEVYRSEEHTSELQSRPHLVCRLLLEKKKIVVAGATGSGKTSQYH